jgi:hypothetical protein
MQAKTCNTQLNFEIQEIFARRVSAVTGIPLEEALLKYTSCYKRIDIEDWDFDASHPTWRFFMDRIKGGQSMAEAAYQLSGAGPDVVRETQRFGCMGFDCRGDVVVMHFRNDFSSPEGPLSRHQIIRAAGNFSLSDVQTESRHQVFPFLLWNRLHHPNPERRARISSYLDRC